MMVSGIIVVSLFACTNIVYISAEIREAKWSKTFINSGVNNSIVGAREPSRAALRCSVTCSQSSQFESFYYSSALKECYCNTQLDLTANPTNVDTGLTYGAGLNVESPDCLALYQSGVSTNGVYVIYPVSGVPVQVWCDMTGGGWTVIQRRQDGSENFYRPWNDYVNGFGTKTGEYWLGLETMSIMTTTASTLRIELETFGDVTPVSAFAEYATFVVGSAASNYPLTVGGFSGNCGDAMAYHNGMPFTTYDSPHDYYFYYLDYNLVGNCASWYKGGWWYDYCHDSNLNGLYLGGANTANSEGINWYQCWGFTYSLKTSVMKIRRNV